MKTKFYLSILIFIYVLLGFATASFAYIKAEGEFVIPEEQIEEIEKKIERSKTLSKEVCTPEKIKVKTKKEVKTMVDGKETKSMVEVEIEEDKALDPDCSYVKKQIEMNGDVKFLSHTTGDTLNAMGTFIFLFLMSAVYLFTSIFLGFAGGFFKGKQNK